MTLLGWSGSMCRPIHQFQHMGLTPRPCSQHSLMLLPSMCLCMMPGFIPYCVAKTCKPPNMPAGQNIFSATIFARSQCSSNANLPGNNWKSHSAEIFQIAEAVCYSGISNRHLCTEHKVGKRHLLKAHAHVHVPDYIRSSFVVTNQRVGRERLTGQPGLAAT